MGTDLLKKLTNHRIAGKLPGEERIIFASGAVTAVMQTLLVREVYSVVSGNELVIGIMVAVWLAATAAGSSAAGRLPYMRPQTLLAVMTVLSIGAMVGVRSIRCVLMPGESITLQALSIALVFVEAPLAAVAGLLFATVAREARGAGIYRREQFGTLVGLVVLSCGVMMHLPNYLIAAMALLSVVVLPVGVFCRLVAAVVIVCFLVSDDPTSAWKYPLPVERIIYGHEGEIAHAAIDGKSIMFVNGAVYAVDFPTPAIEQAVHVPLGMLGNARTVLVINNSGHLGEVRKYPGVQTRCIRLDRLFKDSTCACANTDELGRLGRFDAVLLGCGMPESVAASRFFTQSFFRRMRRLVADSGVFSFTLSLSVEALDREEALIRDIVVSTLREEFGHVSVFPGEGVTFVASDVEYPFPESCRVENSYFDNVILAAVSKERLKRANAPLRQRLLHTAAHPRLILVSLDRFMGRFNVRRGTFVVLLIVVAAFLFSLLYRSGETVSIGSSGFCTGVYSVSLLLLFQLMYGTVYMELSLMFMALAAGFAAGCFVGRFPCSDLVLGTVQCATLIFLVALEEPPRLLFFIGNSAAGFLTAAQFVTRGSTQTARLYAADCAGGVLGMALASTVLLPLFGIVPVAVAIFVIKGAAEVIGRISGSRTRGTAA